MAAAIAPPATKASAMRTRLDSVAIPETRREGGSAGATVVSIDAV